MCRSCRTTYAFRPNQQRCLQRHEMLPFRSAYRKTSQQDFERFWEQRGDEERAALMAVTDLPTADLLLKARLGRLDAS